MKLIFIYGRPGVGKMTISNYLSNKLNIKSFHLHKTIDYVRDVFDRDVYKSESLVDKFSLDMIEFSMKSGIDIIYTYVYAFKEDDYFIKKVLKLKDKYKSNVYFINITCDLRENIKRLKTEDRKKYKKIIDLDIFMDLNNKYILDKPIPFVQGINIDNTHKDVDQVFKIIKKNIK